MAGVGGRGGGVYRGRKQGRTGKRTRAPTPVSPPVSATRGQRLETSWGPPPTHPLRLSRAPLAPHVESTCVAIAAARGILCTAREL
jgi:hypothetical protein